MFRGRTPADVPIEREALIVVDMQPDFIGDVPGEARLAVPGGPEIIEPINRITETFRRKLGERAVILYSQDQHEAPEFDADGNPTKMTAHFSLKPNFVTNWPVHCVAGSFGGSIDDRVIIREGAIIVHKGTEHLTQADVEAGKDTSYSVLNGHVASTNEPVRALLRRLGVTKVTDLGLALDYCVDQTACDAADEGMEVTVVEGATRPVSEAGRARSLQRFHDRGIRVIKTPEEYLAELEAR